MEPKIRIKRYNTRSRHLRRHPRRRGTVATGMLVALILVVAALAVSVALSPPKPAKREAVPEKRAEVAEEPNQMTGAEPAEATATAEASLEATAQPAAAGDKPVSIGSLSLDPKLITPSTLPNSTGDDGLAPVANITVQMSRAATVSIRVLDPDGTTMKRLFVGRLAAGSRGYEWNGKDGRGDAVPSGDYVVRAQVLDSDIADERGAYLEDQLEAVSFITIGNRRRKAVALTIDDGWNADTRIVTYLKKEKVPATAFLIAGRGVVDEHPEFVRTLMGAGMEIANHTYDHAWLTEGSAADVRGNIMRAQEIIGKVSGYNHGWVRPSGGSLNTTVLRVARQAGFRVVQWTIDSADSRGGTTDERVADTLGSATNGAIILTHFGGNDTYDYIRQIVPALRKRGYKFVTMSELMDGMVLDQKDIPPTVPLVRSLQLPEFGALSGMQ